MDRGLICGSYSASPNQDQCLRVHYELQNRSSESWGGATFGSNDGPNVETWRGYKRLSGHESGTRSELGCATGHRRFRFARNKS